MKKSASLVLLVLAAAVAPAIGAEAPYAVEPEFRRLKFGEVMPQGWIREQIVRDLRIGFAGHLPEVAPMTAGANIFGEGRNLPDRIQNAGGGSWGGAEGAWWKGETEGNWRSGNTMMSLMSGDPALRAEADKKVDYLLKTQDPDGYMGIYGPTLRWSSGAVDNGELWTQTTIFRGLIAYYEATGRKDVLQAVQKAVKLTMSHYRQGENDPFGVGTQNHNLMFVDVLERLYDLTGDTAYRDFGVYLYRDYSRDTSTDISLSNLLARDHPLMGHGATTYEHLRVPLWAAYASGDPVLMAAAREGFEKAWPHVSPTGGPVSDEFIANQPTDPDKGGYEGCGEKEWMTSLLSAAQKTGQANFAEQAETTFYNSVQGSRLSDGTGVDYVTTDNIYRIDGAIMNRCIFSPAHEDVADCCPPNFTQITPIFVRNMWMRAQDGLAMILYGPSTVSTEVSGVGIRLAEETSYPFTDAVTVRVDPARAVAFTLRVRVPTWAKRLDAACPGAQALRAGDWLLLTKTWAQGDTVSLRFVSDVTPIPCNNGEFYVRRGPLLYALPIAAIKKANKDYPLPGFHDYLFFPVVWAPARYAFPSLAETPSVLSYDFVANPKSDPRYPWDIAPDGLRLNFLNLDTNKVEPVTLVPMGSSEAILRRTTFPVAKQAHSS
ncbi:MAG TPA: beta-L-arabinofuranosidase domain-containing protein [Opitutaceae bacterium]|jgi:hypothetical protein